MILLKTKWFYSCNIVCNRFIPTFIWIFMKKYIKRGEGGLEYEEGKKWLNGSRKTWLWGKEEGVSLINIINKQGQRVVRLRTGGVVRQEGGTKGRYETRWEGEWSEGGRWDEGRGGEGSIRGEEDIFWIYVKGQRIHFTKLKSSFSTQYVSSISFL